MFNKTKTLVFYLSLVLITTFVVSLWGDSLDIDDDQEVLTFASKRGAATPKLVSLEQANRMIKKGYIQTEVNLLVYDETKDKLKNIYNEGDAKGGQKFTINVRGYNKPLYFYSYKVNSKNKVEKLFPSNSKKFYKSNPIRRYVNYTLPLKERKWLSFDKKKGVENVYFFVSEKPIAELERKVNSRKTLDATLTKYKGRSYNASINKQKEVKVKYKTYPNTVWFKKTYSRKVIVNNKG